MVHHITKQDRVVRPVQNIDYVWPLRGKDVLLLLLLMVELRGLSC